MLSGQRAIELINEGTTIEFRHSFAAAEPGTKSVKHDPKELGSQTGEPSSPFTCPLIVKLSVARGDASILAARSVNLFYGLGPNGGLFHLQR